MQMGLSYKYILSYKFLDVNKFIKKKKKKKKKDTFSKEKNPKLKIRKKIYKKTLFFPEFWKLHACTVKKIFSGFKISMGRVEDKQTIFSRPNHRPAVVCDGTPPNPSTIDVMVGSPSKKQTRARDMLQSLGNLILVRLLIYYEFERV